MFCSVRILLLGVEFKTMLVAAVVYVSVVGILVQLASNELLRSLERIQDIQSQCLQTLVDAACGPQCTPGGQTVRGEWILIWVG